jgi:MutS domain V
LASALVGLGLVAAAGLVVVLRLRARRRLLDRLRAAWGRPRDEPGPLDRIAAYHRWIAGAPGEASLDDRTWQDLNLDEVFASVDRTVSAVGQQALYHRLRARPRGRCLEAFEALVTAMGERPRLRETAGMALVRLRDAAVHDVWWLAQPDTLATEPWHFVFPILTLAMVSLALLVVFWPPALLLLGAGAIVSLVLRAGVASHLQVVVGPFRQVGPLVAAAATLAGAVGDEAGDIAGTLAADVASLRRLRRIASWASRDTGAAAAGDLAAVLYEYLNLLFFIDANALYFGARELRARAPELLRVLAAVGDIDAAIGVASWRASTAGWTRPAFRPAGSHARLVAIRHPLLADAVPNTLVLGPPNGVLVTGSNMSGKTTLLRTVGVNAVLAQTIGTCLAAAWEAPVFVVRSCIGRADNLLEGRSYYLAEVERVMAIVTDADRSAPHLFLFDELFRGTNVVERLAAGEAVLRRLVHAGGVPAPHVVLAATHDGELVDMLDGVYEPVHFGDHLGPEGLTFDYQLLPGPATSRNAIALLRLRGAPREVVDRAERTAGELDRSRVVTPHAAR